MTHFEGVADIARGDIVEITEDGEFITEHMSGRDEGDETYQDYEVNERQLFIRDGDLMFRYRRAGDGPSLVTSDGEARITLRKVV